MRNMNHKKGKKKAQSKKDLNAQFEAFLKDSISSEESLDTARVNKYMKQSKKDEPWWKLDEDEEDDSHGLTGTGRNFMKKKQESSQINGRVAASDLDHDGKDRQLAKDSLDDESFMAFVGNSKTAKPIDGVPALSLGSASFSETTTGNPQLDRAKDGPGRDTLDEIADKEKFFKELERESDSTIDYSKLNRDLDDTTTAGGPLAGRGFLSHQNDLGNSEDLGATKLDVENMSAAEKESMLAKVALLDSLDSTLGTKPAGSRDTALEEMKSIPESNRNGVLPGSDDGDYDDAGISTGTNRGELKKSQDGDDGDEHDADDNDEDAEGSYELKAADTAKGLTLKTGTELTDTSQDVELWKQALRQQVDRSTLDDSTRDFTLHDTTSVYFIGQSQRPHDSSRHGDTEVPADSKHETKEFGMKPLVPPSYESSKERTVEDIIKEVEDLKQNKTENSVRFDDRVQTQDIVDYGSDRHGFDLSPVHTGDMDGTDGHGYDLSPLDKYASDIHPGFDSLDHHSHGKAPVPAKRNKKSGHEPSTIRHSRSRDRKHKDQYSNVRSSGYGKVSPVKSPTPSASSSNQKPVSGSKLKKSASNSHRSPGGTHRSPGGTSRSPGRSHSNRYENYQRSPSDERRSRSKGSSTSVKQSVPNNHEDLVASVHSFAAYVQDHFSNNEQNKKIGSAYLNHLDKADNSFDREKLILTEVQEWQEQWREERKTNVKLKADVASMKKEHSSNLEKQRLEYEQQLLQLQQQNFVLSSKARDNKLASKPSRPASLPQQSDDSEKSGDGDDGESEQVELLRREVKQQEGLLAGYQQENERLYHEMKKLQNLTKDSEKHMFQENQKLSREVAHLREDLGRKEVELRNKGLITGPGVQQQIASGSMSGGAALGAARIAELQADLKLAKSREESSKQELELMIHTNRELEAHVETLRGKVEECERKLTNMDSALAKETEEKCQKEVERLQRKLKWYAENQELLDRDQVLLKEKDCEIKKLRLQMEDKKSQNTKKLFDQRSKERAADARRIQDLERQVKEMEGVLRRRNPNSLPVLMWAAAHDGAENTVKPASVEYLEKRARSLENELEEKDEAAKRELRVLEQKYNLVKIQYEERIENLESQLSRYTRVEDLKEDHHPHTHTTALQRELDSVRDRSRKKITELEAQCEALKKELASIKTKETAQARAESKAASEAEAMKLKSLQLELSSTQRDKQLLETRVEKLTKEKQQLSTEVARMSDPSTKGGCRSRPGSGRSSSSSRPSSGRSRTTLSTPRSQDTVETTPSLPALPPAADADKQYVATSFAGQHISDIVREKEELTAKVERLQVEVDSQRVHLQKTRAESEANQRRLTEECDDKVALLKTAHQQELSELLTQRAVENSTSSLAKLQAKLHTQEVMVEHLKDQARDHQNDREQLAACRIRETTMEAEISRLKESLHEARRSHTPEMRHFAALQEKIEQMETRHAQREHDLQQIIRHHRHVASTELEQEVSKWKKIVEAKNRETESFRNELDSILQLLKDLQKQGVILPCKGMGSSSFHR